MNSSVFINSIFKANALKRSSKFRELSCEYRGYASEAGVGLVPFHEASLPLFNTQTELKQREILNALETSVKICRNTKAQHKKMTDSPALIWQALRELGLRPPSDLFNHMEDCTVVEVYSSENIQLFRTFSFFQYCSYSLEELYCGSWPDLFPRDDQTIVPMILKFVENVFSGVTKKTVSLKHIPNHTVREAFSAARLVLTVGMNWGAPLFQEGTSKPSATIFLETGELVSSQRDRKKYELPRRHLNLIPL